MKASEQTLNEIIRRIVEIARPQSIILFGSGARGEMGPDSDLDLLVIVPHHVHQRKTAQTIYRQLIGVGFAVDIIVATAEDIARYGESDGTVLQAALHEGTVLYAA